MASLSVAAWMQLAAAAVTVVSSVQQGNEAKRQGLERQKAANYQATIAEQNANAERASAQRQASEERRRSVLAQSRVQALAGGSGLDAGVVDLVGDLEGEGEYRALSALYEGDQRSNSSLAQAGALRYQGENDRIAGENAQSAGYMKAGSSLLSTGTSLYGKYGAGGPSAGSGWAPDESGSLYSKTGADVRARR